MWGKSWKWVEDSEQWAAFLAWRQTRSWADRVELEAALETLLDRGPEDGFPKLGLDLYAIFACRRRTIFWVVVGVARPGKRLLLPLAWGVNADDKHIAEAALQASEALSKWRSI